MKALNLYALKHTDNCFCPHTGINLAHFGKCELIHLENIYRPLEKRDTVLVIGSYLKPTPPII